MIFFTVQCFRNPLSTSDWVAWRQTTVPDPSLTFAKFGLRQSTAIDLFRPSGKINDSASIGWWVTGSLITLQIGYAARQPDKHKHGTAPAAGLDSLIDGKHSVATRHDTVDDFPGSCMDKIEPARHVFPEGGSAQVCFARKELDMH
jgi:hypothetical protein